SFREAEELTFGVIELAVTERSPVVVDAAPQEHVAIGEQPCCVSVAGSVQFCWQSYGTLGPRIPDLSPGERRPIFGQASCYQNVTVRQESCGVIGTWDQASRGQVLKLLRFRVKKLSVVHRFSVTTDSTEDEDIAIGKAVFRM